MKTLLIPHTSRLAIAIVALASFAASAQEFHVLRHFTGTANDGAQPLGSLAVSGSALFGMTKFGGVYSNGILFRMDTSGAGFTVLRSFDTATNDGQNPYGTPLVIGNDIYGMVTTEISGRTGTIFRIGTDGANWQVLRRFSGTDGKWPYGDLVESGGMLYGLNTYGGSSTGSGWVGNGTLFQISTNGSNYLLLHKFTGGSSDGANPHGSPLVSNSVIYGMTGNGGNSGMGTIFRINTDTNGYQIIHHFAGGTADGQGPGGGLLLSGSTLYGMTRQGGVSNNGTIFRIDTNGANFQVLHSFTGATNDGVGPVGGTLVQSGATLYGMTYQGGTAGTGAIFSLNTNGGSFQVLHNFNGTDGGNPLGSLTLSGSTLYGMTYGGGSNNLGAIFALDLPRPALAISKSGTNIDLSWDTNCTDFTLENTDRLGGTWTSVPGVTGYSATLPIVATTNQFFRLRN